MHSATLFLLACVAVSVLAGGQFYVPRSYYTIDIEGHASAPVPLRRLRRSLPIPYETVANKHAALRGLVGDSGSGVWSPSAGWMRHEGLGA